MQGPGRHCSGPFCLRLACVMRMVVSGVMVVVTVVMAGKGGDAHHRNGEEEQQNSFHGRILEQLRKRATVR